MILDDLFTVFQRLSRIEAKLDRLLILAGKEVSMANALDQKIADLQGDLNKLSDAETSVKALLVQQNQMLADAIAAAKAAGATDAQLQQLTDLHTGIAGKIDALAADVLANTPAAPTP